MVRRVGEVERADCDDNVRHHAKHTLKVVGTPITQERAHRQNGKNQSDRVEDGEVVVHADTDTPANQYYERCVEQGSLDRRTQNMSESHVDLVVVGFVDSEQMFGDLLNKWNQNKTDKGVTDTPLLYNVWDLEDEGNGDKRYASQGDEKGDDDFGHGKLGLRQLLVAVLVLVIVRLVDFVEQTIVRYGLEVHVDQVAYD